MQVLRKRKYGDIILFRAVRESQNCKTTKLLIELGANVNYATPTTPLNNVKGGEIKSF